MACRRSISKFNRAFLAGTVALSSVTAVATPTAQTESGATEGANASAGRQPQKAGPILLDGVAASVGRQVITLSEVDLEARLLLVQRGGPLGVDAPIDDALRAKVLEYLIVQETLVREASRRGGFLIAERDIDRALATRRAKLRSEEQYARFLRVLNADEERLRGIARRDLVVTALLDRALAPVEVNDDDITTFLANNPTFLAGAPAVGRRNRAKERVAAAKKQQAFKALTAALMKTIEVRRIAPYAVVPLPPRSTADEK